MPADLLRLAEDIGFSHYAELNMNALIARSEIRDMCITGKCQRYGKSWSCPPACGSLETCAARMKQYSSGILVQTTALMEDEFDMETVNETGEKHKQMFITLARQTRMLYPDCLPLTAGSCTLCRKCTYPAKPCRFPDRRFASMEAYGLLVSDVCLQSGLKYYYGPRTLTFSSCILTKEGTL